MESLPYYMPGVALNENIFKKCTSIHKKSNPIKEKKAIITV